MHDKETVNIVTEMRHKMVYSYWIICGHKPLEISNYSTDSQILKLNTVNWTQCQTICNCCKIKKSPPNSVQYSLNNDLAQHFHNKVKQTQPGGSHISVIKYMDLRRLNFGITMNVWELG
jgi:hypothetical protein